MLQDLMELRKNKWVLRRKVGGEDPGGNMLMPALRVRSSMSMPRSSYTHSNATALQAEGPKKIDDIHREAENEARMKAALDRQAPRGMPRGGRGPPM